MQGVRNTPTCVGKTCQRTVRGFPRKKHPHVRGEDLYRMNGRVAIGETPPRAWGRQLVGLQSFHSQRNTPTCVGKTARNRNRNGNIGKHPHVRGEDRRCSNSARVSTETPPRAWGRLDTLRSFWVKHRNTPTCVGKTGGGYKARRNWKKHPHVRGEDNRYRFTTSNELETPPRAWGRH